MRVYIIGERQGGPLHTSPPCPSNKKGKGGEERGRE